MAKCIVNCTAPDALYRRTNVPSSDVISTSFNQACRRDCAKLPRGVVIMSHNSWRPCSAGSSHEIQYVFFAIPTSWHYPSLSLWGIGYGAPANYVYERRRVWSRSDQSD